MRQLFLPACVCLVTWSGTTASEPNPSLENFSGAARTPEKAVALSQPEVTDEVVLKLPEKSAPATGDADLAVSEIAVNLAIEYPVPSGAVIDNGEPVGVPLPPVPKPVVTRSREEICGTLAEAAERNDLPVPFFIRLLFQESRFRPGVVSPAGAQGIAQFMPDTAAGVGLDNPFDPLQAIPASARLLRTLIQQFGNLGLAAAAYNAGPKRIQDWLEKKGKLPEETKGYVKIITGHPADNWKGSKRDAELNLPRRAPCQEEAKVYAMNVVRAVPLPQPSPYPHRVIAVVKTAKAAPKAAIKTAEKSAAKPAANSTSKSTGKTTTKTAANSSSKSTNTSASKSASKSTATQQLAARKQKSHSKPERVAQR